jgi:hypothetical protein
MSGWTPAADRPGYLVKTVERGPCTISIYRPATDEETQAKNEKKAKTALENALREHYRRTVQNG